MHEGINVEGVCRGVDKDIMLMHMQNMKTPFTTYPYATVRLPDVLYANFKINKQHLYYLATTLQVILLCFYNKKLKTMSQKTYIKNALCH